MYISAKTAERIKALAKAKGIIIKDMLEECELGKNTLSSMLSRGSWLQANNLAKIADYLGCSVDYLLGRSDEKSTPVAPEYDEGTKKLIDAIVALPHEKKKALADLMGIDYE